MIDFYRDFHAWSIATRHDQTTDHDDGIIMVCSQIEMAETLKKRKTARSAHRSLAAPSVGAIGGDVADGQQRAKFTPGFDPFSVKLKRVGTRAHRNTATNGREDDAAADLQRQEKQEVVHAGASEQEIQGHVEGHGGDENRIPLVALVAEERERLARGEPSESEMSSNDSSTEPGKDSDCFPDNTAGTAGAVEAAEEGRMGALEVVVEQEEKAEEGTCLQKGEEEGKQQQRLQKPFSKAHGLGERSKGDVCALEHQVARGGTDNLTDIGVRQLGPEVTHEAIVRDEDKNVLDTVTDTRCVAREQESKDSDDDSSFFTSGVSIIAPPQLSQVINTSGDADEQACPP